MVSSEPDSDNETRQISTTYKTLAFHKILPRFTYGSTNYSPKRFGRLMESFFDRSYRFANPAELDSPPEGKTILITFDDGYQHLADYLPPLMEKYYFVPLIFIPTGCIGASNRWDYSNLFMDDPHLDRSTIKKLSSLGVIFGSHGHSHTAFTHLSERELTEELRVSKQTIEDITGREVAAISYPFGRYNNRVLEAVNQTGYRHGFTMSFPTEGDTLLTQGRIGIYGYDTLFTINQKLSGGRLYQLERWKARFTNRLAGGTILLNRLTGRGKSTPAK